MPDPFCEPQLNVWRRHPLGLDAADRERLLFLARVMSFRWLADAIEFGGDTAKHVGWVQACLDLVD